MHDRLERDKLAATSRVCRSRIMFETTSHHCQLGTIMMGMMMHSPHLAGVEREL